MKIAIDLHGTITKYPESFKIMIDIAIDAGHEVIILSGAPEVDVEDELSELGVHRYHRILSVVDWLLRRSDVDMWLNKQGSWETDEKIWWSSKAIICKQEQIDILIDDKVGYKPGFEKINTIFVLLD